VYFESAYYLGAGEGGEKPYRLLVDVLAKTNRAAIAQLVTRGKEQLMLIRPYENGLIMHSLYYANEVRNFADIAKGENTKLSDAEIDLGADLNVFITRSSSPSIRVNTKFQETRKFNTSVWTVECNSKGIIEELILRHVADMQANPAMQVAPPAIQAAPIVPAAEPVQGSRFNDGGKGRSKFWEGK
jgi:hypothetical protein